MGESSATAHFGGGGGGCEVIVVDRGFIGVYGGVGVRVGVRVGVGVGVGVSMPGEQEDRDRGERRRT